MIFIVAYLAIRSGFYVKYNLLGRTNMVCESECIVKEVEERDAGLWLWKR